MDCDYDEEREESSNEVPEDEYVAAADQDALQFGFGSSNPGRNDKQGNPIITVVDRARHGLGNPPGTPGMG